MEEDGGRGVKAGRAVGKAEQRRSGAGGEAVGAGVSGSRGSLLPPALPDSPPAARPRG